jgi:hypothetical protein
MTSAHEPIRTSDLAGCQCQWCLDQTTILAGHWLSRTLWRVFEVTGQHYMHAEGVLTEPDSRPLYPEKEQIVNGIAEIERFLSKRARRRAPRRR